MGPSVRFRLAQQIAVQGCLASIRVFGSTVGENRSVDFELEPLDGALSISALGMRSVERDAEGWELLGVACAADGSRHQIWMRLNVQTLVDEVA